MINIQLTLTKTKGFYRELRPPRTSISWNRLDLEKQVYRFVASQSQRTLSRQIAIPHWNRSQNAFSTGQRTWRCPCEENSRYPSSLCEWCSTADVSSTMHYQWRCAASFLVLAHHCEAQIFLENVLHEQMVDVELETAVLLLAPHNTDDLLLPVRYQPGWVSHEELRRVEASLYWLQRH